jgi:DNA polymerase III sliding clamp (beta) subunit (PCNA family)
VSEDRGDEGSLEFSVRRFQILQLVKWAAVAVPASPTVPVYGCFQVTVSEDRLCLAAAGQRLSVTAETPAVTAPQAGTVYIPAKKLEAMLNEAPEGDVRIVVKGGIASVTAGSASWSLRLPPADGYDDLPDLSGAGFAPVNRGKLLAALTTVRHAVGKDAGRPAFAQVNIAAADSGGMYACATDSGQFSRAPVDGFPVPVSVPGAVLTDLVKLLSSAQEDNVEVADTGSYVAFRAGTVTMTVLKMTHAFPDPGQFLKPVQGNDRLLRVDKAELARALRRVRINADTTTSAVALIADGGDRPILTVESRDKDGNSAEEVISASWANDRQLLVVNAGVLEAMLTAHPSATCEFKVGLPRGRVLPALLLEDTEARVTGICPQLPPVVLGY